MHKINDFLVMFDGYIGGHPWFVILLPGTGSLPQINSISNSIFATFGINHIITGAVLSVLLASIIIGGIKRIAKVTEKLVPGMAIFYFIGALLVIYYRLIFVGVFLVASFTDTTIICSLSYITIALMTIPNLIRLWILRKEIKSVIADYWADFSVRHPEDRMSKKYLKDGKL